MRPQPVALVARRIQHPPFPLHDKVHIGCGSLIFLRSEMKEESKVYIGSLMLVGITIGTYAAMANYMLPLSEALGVGMSQASMIFTFIGLGGVVASFALGAAMKLFSARVLVLASAVMAALYYGALAMASSLPLIYATAVLFGVCQIFGGIGMAQALINLWFKEGAGKRIGMLSVSYGLLGFAASPAIAIGITQLGLGTTAAIQGAISAAVLAGAAMLMPGKGVMPAHAEDKVEEEKDSGSKESVLPIVKGLPFWLVLLGIIASNIASTGLLNNASSVYQTMGATAVEASLCISLYSAAMLVAAPAFGALADKTSPAIAVTVFGLLQAGVLALTFVLTGFVGCAIIGTLAGVMCFGSMAGALVYPKMYGAKSATTLIGFGIAGQNFGAMVGSPIAAMFYDATGSYELFIVLAASLALFCVIAVNVAMKAKKNA